MAMRDVVALLGVLEQHPTLRLVPVIFDFSIGDGVRREKMGLVGEHPDWIVRRRVQFLDAVEPILAKLATHPQVAMIDLFNEAEQMKTVPADEYVEFIQELATRVRKHNPNMKVTVGSRTSIDAVFWRAVVNQTTFHWFDKIEIRHLPLGYAPDGINRNAAIVTEVDPTVGVAVALDKLWSEGFQGALFWSLSADDGMPFRGQAADEFQNWVIAARQEKQ
jgi:hypothetical protein